MSQPDDTCSSECGLTRSISLRVGKDLAKPKSVSRFYGKFLTLPRDSAVKIANELKKLDQQLGASSSKGQLKQYLSIQSIDSDAIGEIDALFGSFHRYTSFFQTTSEPLSCPSSPASDVVQTFEESVLTTKWFFDIIREQQPPHREKKPLGAQACANFVTFTGPVLAIYTRSLLMDVKPRTAILSKRVLYLFKEANNNPKCKEKISMGNVISLETNRPCGIKVSKDLFGFTLKVGSMKTSSSETCLNKKQANKSKQLRQSYFYAVDSEATQTIWMQKLLEAITRRFVPSKVANVLHASQCYAKYKVSGIWLRGWVVMTQQRRLVHCFDGGTPFVFDLRKTKQIQLTKEDAIKRSSIFMECLPTNLHIILDSEADTHKWYELTKSFEMTYRNMSLEEQQLTKENVPVVVEKCLRFIFSYGSMTEDIYAVPGNSGKVKRLLEAFREDAFGVHLTYNQFNEHDIASVLLKVLQDLPKTLVGDLSASFMCVSDITSMEEKRVTYKELLQRLSHVEYLTLRTIISHLHALHSLKPYNKMSARKLALIWGKHLLTDLTDESLDLFQKENNVVYDLIVDYKDTFSVHPDEEMTEIINQPYLKKLDTDSPPSSDSRKIWIKVLPNDDGNPKAKHKLIPIVLTPKKTVNDVRYELIFEMRLPPEGMTMSEVIRSGELRRPMHPNEIVLDTIERWDNWPDASDNCLVVVPSKFFNHIEVLSNMKTDYDVEYKCNETTDPKKQLSLELTDSKVVLLGSDKKQWLEIRDSFAFFGSNKKLVILIEDRAKQTHQLIAPDVEDQVLLFVSLTKRYHQIHCHYETSEI